MAAVDPVFIPVTCYLVLMAFLGGIGNLIIIVATIKAKTMRSTCNMLIFCICVCDFCQLQGQWQYFIYMWTGKQMPQYVCFNWEILSVAGLYFCGPLQLVVAVDRLIAVTFPLQYITYQRHPVKYFFVLFILPLSYVIASVMDGFVNTTTEYMPCSLPAAFMSQRDVFLQVVMNSSYALAAVTYVLVVIAVRIKGANDHFKAVFKSITIYLALILITFFFTNLFDIAVEYLFPLNQYQKDVFHTHAGIAICTCISSNIIVFYTLNRQYRLAINGLFKFKKRVNFSNSPSAASGHR